MWCHVNVTNLCRAHLISHANHTPLRPRRPTWKEAKGDQDQATDQTATSTNRGGPSTQDQATGRRRQASASSGDPHRARPNRPGPIKEAKGAGEGTEQALSRRALRPRRSTSKESFRRPDKLNAIQGLFRRRTPGFRKPPRATVRQSRSEQSPRLLLTPRRSLRGKGDVPRRHVHANGETTPVPSGRTFKTKEECRSHQFPGRFLGVFSRVFASCVLLRVEWLGTSWGSVEGWYYDVSFRSGRLHGPYDDPFFMHSYKLSFLYSRGLVFVRSRAQAKESVGNIQRRECQPPPLFRASNGNQFASYYGCPGNGDVFGRDREWGYGCQQEYYQCRCNYPFGRLTKRTKCRFSQSR